MRSLGTVRVGEGGAAIDSCMAEASLEVGTNRVGDDDSFEGDLRSDGTCAGPVGASFEGWRTARERVLGERDFDSPRSMTKCIP